MKIKVILDGDRSIIRRPIGPTAHWSDGPLVRRPIGPTTHWSDDPLVLLCRIAVANELDLQ